MNRVLSTALVLMIAVAANAQQGNLLTVKDYERAESRLGYNTEPLVDNNFSGRPNWLSDDRCWYRILTARGSEFILVNPAKGTRSAAFDQEKLAAALSTAAGTKVEAFMLPFQTFTYSPDGRSISFRASGKQWSVDLQSYACTADNSTAERPAREEGRRARGRNEVLSPDGKRAAFIKDYNLWVRDVTTNQPIQLTTDGIKDFGYATDNAGWSSSDGPILQWSPDSKKIASFKQDQRNASDMYPRDHQCRKTCSKGMEISFTR